MKRRGSRETRLHRRTIMIIATATAWLAVDGTGTDVHAEADGVSVRSVPHSEAVTTGERAHAAIADVEKFYDENYFSQGRSIHDMHGTGYHPWWRVRHHFEQRQDHTGRLDPMLRWERYREIRAKTLRAGAYRSAASWTLVGPEPFEGGEGGRMLCAAFHPDDPSTIYAGASAAGLWRSEDDGQSWVPLTDQLPSMSVSSVALNPFNPDMILIGTGWGWGTSFTSQPGVGVLRSLDAGLTWNTTFFEFPLSGGVGTYDLPGKAWVRQTG